MKKALCVMSLLTGLLFMYALACAGSRVDGIITEDTTWTSEGSPYISITDLTVEEDVTLTVEGNVVILAPGWPVVDNPEATYVGDWPAAAPHPSAYGEDYQYDADGTGTGSDTATWQTAIPTAGNYSVYAWWRESLNRATNAPYTIYYEGGSDTVRVSQQVRGGQWNYLGTYPFGEGIYSVVLSDDADGFVIADAVRFDPNEHAYPYPVCDNPEATYVGKWTPAAPHPSAYGEDYYYNIDGAGTGTNIATWRTEIPTAGNYHVYARWRASSNCATDAPYTINYEGGSETVDMCQQVRGGRWNYLGTYPFGAEVYSVVLSDDADGFVIADAIRFEPEEDSTPFPYRVCDNPEADYTGRWETDIHPEKRHYDEDAYYNVDGAAGTGQSTATWRLTVHEPGTYNVYAWWTEGLNRATDAPYTINYQGGSATVRVSQRIGGGRWNYLGSYYCGEGIYSVVLSDDADGYVIADAIQFEHEPSRYPVCDNPDATYVGKWKPAAPHPSAYGEDYYFNVDGPGTGSNTATWGTAIPAAGSYNVYAWWKESTNRATNAPYTIHHCGGSDTVRVNQQIDGGQWNLLGTYQFAGGASAKVVLSDDANGYVIADAIKWEPVE